MYDSVKDYYGKVLSNSDDLKTNACCTDEDLPEYLKKILEKVHDEVVTRYYGCGLVLPQLLKGTRILDLGCGAGRDCYVLSYLTGEEGKVVGVDMTDEQLDVARRHIGYHTEKFGFKNPNISFVKGYIENLDQLGLEEESFDIIVSNCVINLSPDKEAVLKGAYKLLKPGGEIYFSDVYSESRVPKEYLNDPVLYGECLSGALYWNDFQNLAKHCGYTDPRLVHDREIKIDNPEIEEKIGHINFYSATYRLFKISGLESHCEDYGQAVIYKGTVDNSEHCLVFDKHHELHKGKVFPVCGNTWKMLKETRFCEHFEFIGNFENHYGIFSGCGYDMPFGQREADVKQGCC